MVGAFLRCVVALVWILRALHSSAAEGEGIEKVSYLLQYGPGVHTVFEVEGNSSDKAVVPTGSSTGPSSTLHQPSTTTTMRSDLNTVTIGAIEIASSAPQGAAGDAAHRLESETDDRSQPPSSPGEGPNVTEGAELTTVRAVGLINTATSIVSSASTYLSSTLDPQKGSLDDGLATGAGSERPSPAVGATVNRLPTLLPPPPALPNFGSMLHTDVMMNLKPKELRALMSTYITLIETYKSFNQQQRRNIAQLTKELESFETKDQLGART